jgi:hypothetical protein
MAANDKAEKNGGEKRKKGGRTPKSHGSGAGRTRMTLAIASPTRKQVFEILAQ